MTRFAPIALIGFGEVGQILAEHLLRTAVGRIDVYDNALEDSGRELLHPPPCEMLGAPWPGAHIPVTYVSSAGAAVRHARLVISAVSAGEALAAARSASPGLAAGAFYLDLSCCTSTDRRAAAAAVEAASAHYVEGTLTGSIRDSRAASPMGLTGPAAMVLATHLRALGFLGAEVRSDSASSQLRWPPRRQRPGPKTAR